MDNGWIKVHRSLLDSPVWKSIKVPAHGSILITLLLMASHSEYKGFVGNKEIMVQPGQIVTSLQGICDRVGMGVTKQNVRGALEKFEEMGFLTQAPTKTGRLITIVNWGIYQGNESVTNKGTNKEPTKNQQRTNNVSNTIQEDIKNVKKDKKSSRVFTPPTREEVAAYCLERRNKVDPERFIDYYTSNGWMVGKNHMKDWKATIRRWEKSEDKPAEKSSGQSGWNYSGQRQYDDKFFEEFEGGKK